MEDEKCQNNTKHKSEKELDMLDDLSVTRLEMMDHLISCKKEMENSLREGFFLLGKARYVMGVQSVSMLQIPSSECDIEALYNTSVSEEPLSEFPSLKSHQFSIHPNQMLVKDNRNDEPNLRKRGAVVEEVNQANVEAITDEATLPKLYNPLNWFSALPPQSLRTAQQHFKKALLLSAECATIQSKLLALKM